MTIVPNDPRRRVRSMNPSRCRSELGAGVEMWFAFFSIVATSVPFARLGVKLAR
ncbi:hypothetical protein NYA30BAC_01508 [Halomonas sp. NYA30]